MNSEQLQDFLSDLSTSAFSKETKNEVESTRKLLCKVSSNTMMCCSYISCNYTDIDHVQPILGQLLALYYKKGKLRHYVLQYIPTLISCYMIAVSKKQQKSVSMFETFFLAVYNEEILVTAPDTEDPVKKIEEIRIPSIRFPSIYHDPSKISGAPEFVTIKPGSAPAVLCTVAVGPYPTIERFTAEQKFLILTRILKSVNSGLCFLSEVVARQMCLLALSVCRSGFSFPETNFRASVMHSELSNETLDDYARKPRQQVNSSFLQEILSGVYLSLFHGCPDLALRAIDAAHQRAQYEFLPEVLMVTSAIRTSLLDSHLSKEKRDELLWTKQQPQEGMRRKEMVTNASLRMRRMPEDISVVEEKEKEHSRLEELVEEGIDHLQDLKKRMKELALQPTKGRRRKSNHAIDTEEVELQPIYEGAERGDTVIENVEVGNETLNTTTNGDATEIETQRDIRETMDMIEEQIDTDFAKTEPTPFSVGGLRHMDSGGSSHRSCD